MKTLRQDLEATDLTTVLLELEELRRRVERLEQARRPRVVENGPALVRAIACSTAGFAFGATELLTHARTDDALRHALYTAQVRTPRRLGLLLRQLAALPPVDDLRIVRLPRDGDGARWIVASL